MAARVQSCSPTTRNCYTRPGCRPTSLDASFPRRVRECVGLLEALPTACGRSPMCFGQACVLLFLPRTGLQSRPDGPTSGGRAKSSAIRLARPVICGSKGLALRRTTWCSIICRALGRAMPGPRATGDVVHVHGGAADIAEGYTGGSWNSWRQRKKTGEIDFACLSSQRRGCDLVTGNRESFLSGRALSNSKIMMEML